ncbi:MAG: helix-turn-helix domain-containing protein, partial [Acutalibacteraceae bacterium]
MDVGSRIKYFRNKRNLSVNKLATISGVSQSYLRDIELGNKQPTVEYLEYICFGLNITL